MTRELQASLQVIADATQALDAQGAADLIATAVAASPGTPVWATYTPALTAVTTNPILGAGSTATGQYWRSGDLVHCEVWIKFGSSGINKGSGLYSVSLPVTAAASLRTGGSMPLGHGWVLPAGTLSFVTVELETTTKVQLRQGGGGSQVVSDVTPGTWAANGEITLVFDYRAAP